MDYYRELYNNLKNEYEIYQNYTEKKIQQVINRNIKLEKDMDILSNIVQISQYINSYIRDKNLVSMINDMIIGVLGVKHSSIYTMKLGKLEIRASSPEACKMELTEEERKNFEEGREYIFNSNTYLKICPSCKTKIKSSMGMPIKLRDKFIGYIIVDHTINLTEENRIFLRSISNQIAIALENSILYMELSNMAKKDPLMGIYNRKYFFKKVEKLLEKEKDIDYAIVMLDLDNFKKINDTFGHQYGDEVLKVVGRVVIKNALKTSIFARYGGEELILFVYGFKNKEEVYNQVETMRKEIQDKEIILGDIKSNATASLGLAFSSNENRTLLDIINKADMLLYKAKHNGKNRVVCEEEFIKETNIL